jgi:phage-related protein (TIGR01555 family)
LGELIVANFLSRLFTRQDNKNVDFKVFNEEYGNQKVVNSYTYGYNGGAVNPAVDIGTAHDITNYTVTAPPRDGYEWWQELDNIYQTNIFAQLIIDTPATDMTDKWRYFICDDAEIKEKRELAEYELNIASSVREAIKWADLYGTCALIINTGNGQSNPDRYATPLTDEEVIREGVHSFDPVFMGQLNPMGSPALSPFSDHFGRPEYYSVTGTETFRIHCSRLIIFDGLDLPLYARIRRAGFGLSRLTAIKDELQHIKVLTKSLINLASKASVDHLGVQGFLNLALSQCQDESSSASMSGYLGAVKRILSNQRIMVTDAEDKFTRNELSTLSSWPDLLKFLIQMVSGPSGLTLGKVLGEGIAGFNSGDTELLQYANMISKRQSLINEQLKRLDDIVELSIFGKRLDIKYVFNSIILESDGQKADRFAREASTDSLYLNDQVLTREIILKRIQAQGEYSISDEYIADVVKMEEEDDFADEIADPDLMSDLEPVDTRASGSARPTDTLDG